MHEFGMTPHLMLLEWPNQGTGDDTAMQKSLYS
jgi:hypothetical protein